jgi:hypothetical protein
MQLIWCQFYFAERKKILDMYFFLSASLRTDLTELLIIVQGMALSRPKQWFDAAWNHYAAWIWISAEECA